MKRNKWTKPQIRQVSLRLRPDLRELLGDLVSTSDEDGAGPRIGLLNQTADTAEMDGERASDEDRT